MTVSTSPSAPSGLGINFDAIAGKDVQPKGAADNTLSSAARTGQLQQLSCRSVLTADQLVQVRAYAMRLYPEMLEDRTQLSNFGVESLAGVNACVSRILRQQSSLQIPEVDQFTKEMNATVNGFRSKYDMSNPKVRENFEMVRNYLAGIFNQGRHLLSDLYQDSLDVETRLDKIAGKLVERKMALEMNVALCDELYEQNEAAIVQLIGVIAIMEQIRDEATSDSQQLQQELTTLQPGTPGRRDKEEVLSNVTEFIGDIDTRINEFVQRLFIAWSTSPQVRNIRKISYGLAQRLGLLVQLTIPTLKMTVAVWGTLLQAQKAGKVVEEISATNDAALAMFASAASTAVPLVAQVVQTPSTRPETIMAIANSIVEQNQGLEEAVRYGNAQRALVVDAIVTAGQAITASSQQLNDTVIDLVTRAQTPLELPAAPTVPEEILQTGRTV